MIIDARSLPEHSQIDAEVCVVGAGAAGITIARELRGLPLRVCLLESGGLDPDARTQEFCRAEIDGPDVLPPTATRTRCFGGTTARWSGLCRPLDPIDFEERPNVRWSGWPFSAEHLMPYYRRAHELCRLGPFAYDARPWSPPGGPPPLPTGGEAIRSAVFQNNPPVHFGVAYRREIETAPNITALLRANAVGIETDEAGREIHALRVATLDGPRHLRVTGKLFVLAAGGIENARLLLNAGRRFPRGLGNEYDLVGRFYADHPKIWKAGRVFLVRPLPEPSFYDYHWVGGTRIQGVFTPTDAAMRSEDLWNFTICLDHPSPADLSRGAAALRTWRRARTRRPPARQDVGRVGRAIATDLPGLARAVWRTRIGHAREIFSTRYWCDTPPDPDSRVTLSDEVDALGLRRARIAWRLPSDLGWQVRRAHELLDEALAGAGLGRAVVNTADDVQDPVSDVENSCHHMGTTRMQPDPRRGVVDEHCRVHGIGNLYVAGSSVFPTGGQANPTLTVVALAVRLAESLKRAMSEPTLSRLAVVVQSAGDVAAE
jgi:choline dehydrogenase-like flavoprotein